jgi:regulator of sigma E protease
MNLLPIPALDGGHVVFLLVEMVIRRPLSEKFMQVMQVIGMVLLLGLMVFAFGNDIYKIFAK